MIIESHAHFIIFYSIYIAVIFLYFRTTLFDKQYFFQSSSPKKNPNNQTLNQEIKPTTKIIFLVLSIWAKFSFKAFFILHNVLGILHRIMLYNYLTKNYSISIKKIQMILKYLQYIILTHIKNTYIILCLLSTNTEQNRLYKIFSYCNK